MVGWVEFRFLEEEATIEYSSNLGWVNKEAYELLYSSIGIGKTILTKKDPRVNTIWNFCKEGSTGKINKKNGVVIFYYA